MAQAFLKRVLDLAGAFVLILLLLPLALIIAILILIDSGGPIIFKQERVGKNLHRFQILKFRTMHNVIVSDQFQEAVIQQGADSRITRVGSVLRKTSLDELPQLLNILVGQMSFVGPRPIIPEQLRAIPEGETTRFSVKPGITGLAQVSGRRGLNWLKQLELDKSYANEWSLQGDFIILIQTILVVFRGSGIYGTAEDNWRSYIKQGDDNDSVDGDM